MNKETHPQNITADIPFNVPVAGFHVTMTLIPFDEGKKDKTVHHLVLGAETEAEAIAAVQDRWYREGITAHSERWTVERCVRMNRPDNDKTIVFKL